MSKIDIFIQKCYEEDAKNMHRDDSKLVSYLRFICGNQQCYINKLLENNVTMDDIYAMINHWNDSFDHTRSNYPIHRLPKSIRNFIKILDEIQFPFKIIPSDYAPIKYAELFGTKRFTDKYRWYKKYELYLELTSTDIENALIKYEDDIETYLECVVQLLYDTSSEFNQDICVSTLIKLCDYLHLNNVYYKRLDELLEMLQ